MLILFGGGALYGYTHLQSAQAEARDAKGELKAAMARAAAAEKKASAAQTEVAFTKAKISEGEANLAKLTKDAEQKEQAASELESKLQSLL